MIEGPGHVPLTRLPPTSCSRRNSATVRPFISWTASNRHCGRLRPHNLSHRGRDCRGCRTVISSINPCEHLGFPTPMTFTRGLWPGGSPPMSRISLKGFRGPSRPTGACSSPGGTWIWRQWSVSHRPGTRKKAPPGHRDREGCSMCGKLCAVKISRAVERLKDKKMKPI